MTLTPTNFSGRGLDDRGEFRHKSKVLVQNLSLLILIKMMYMVKVVMLILRDNRIFSDNLKRDGDRWLGTQMSSSINIGGILI